MNKKKPVMRDVEQLASVVDTTPLRVGKPIRIVIADDERDTVMTLGVLLRSEGFDVKLAERGSEVAGLVAAMRPQAVLLDIAMPGRSGYDVAEELRRTYAERCPLLVAVTARTSPEDRMQAYASGFRHYFAKPYNAAELVRFLSALTPGPAASAS